MEINTICVCGAGTMGAGIAQAVAQSGFSVLLYDLDPAGLERAEQNIQDSLSFLVNKGKISAAEKENILRNVHYTEDIQICLADVFIEAIIERIEFKIAIFNQLAELNHGESIFCTNTSSLSVTAIAEGVNNPQRVIGMHFFNPAVIMKLVEVVITDYTDDQTKQTIIELTRQMGKTAVVCKDSPGFIVNRVARPYYIESLRIAEETGGDYKQIDRLLESAGFKMGPFKLMDLIGNDINYAVSCSVYEQLNNTDRLKPSYIQEELVKNGKLGKKTGSGYYKY